MSLIDVQGHDFLKELIKGLIGMCDDKRSLLWEVVVEEINNLNGYIRFTRSRWAHNHGQPGIHPDLMASTCVGVNATRFLLGRLEG
ncbi:Uncharacterized protein FKW44_019008 [Caligus rogercresseyi]|uniref:Uncharacterized protein n=1 Tax=Caligus rogercresseyi TaxID=217165 RepID=A0A7T8JX80_CALRO|nr:Uncharacterized protein FKW44_019008 [Caligus rogercresseyi]